MTIIAGFFYCLPFLPAAESPAPGRFFREGNGELTLYSRKNERSGKIRYRNPDGTYSEEGIREINRIFDVPKGSSEGISLRFLSLVDFLEDHFRVDRVEILSGYRDPQYNEKLKENGAKAARMSLHLDGEAADLIFPKIPSQKVWEYVRSLECCGIGIYRDPKKYPGVGGTVHVDTGPKRYWDETTTGTEKVDLRKNHMIVAWTDRDIYFPGETVSLKLVRVTDYPIVADPEIEVLDDSGKPRKFSLDGTKEPLQIARRTDRLTTLRWTIPADFSPKGAVTIRIKFPEKFRKDFPDMSEAVVSNPIRIVAREGR
ncbi:MAG: DUF882 domain-containing protein [Deltaproteobacteria bacterium]|nr:DUF882 domain-containing protein [Deltaproteobacteria bacterium]